MNTIVEQFLSISIVGSVLSLFIQWLQNKYGVEGSQTKAIAIFGSIVLGGLVYFLSALPIWTSILGVLAAASTVYAMFFSGNRK